MSKNEVKKQVKKYADVLSQYNVQFEHLYLFGSFVTGKQTRDSDIDILVVTKRFPRNSYNEYKKQLWRLTRFVDTRIEPHACTVEDFKKGETLPAIEAKRYGIKII